MSEENGDDNDPLEDLYVDGDEIDRQLLADALNGVIGIDRDSAEPKLLSGFHDLSTRQQFIALLLYRRATVALGDIPEKDVGMSSGELGDIIGVDDSTIRHGAGDLDFVDSDQAKGGYYLPGYNLQVAVDFIAEE